MPSIVIKSKDKEYICLFDKRDQKKISRFTWSLNSKGYAVASIKGKTVLMHRFLLGIQNRPEVETDHKHHNKLDNRRSQIRICTHAENRRNSRKLKESAQSQFKGVYRDNNKFHVQILEGQKVKNLGRFRSEKTAAKVYDYHARELFKEFAFLNFPRFKEVEQSIIPGF